MKEGIKIYDTIGTNTIMNRNIPEASGVYIIISRKEILYIGQSWNVRRRIAQHFSSSLFRDNFFDVEDAWRVIVIKTEDNVSLESSLLNLIPTKNNGCDNWFKTMKMKENFPVEDSINRVWDGFK